MQTVLGSGGAIGIELTKALPQFTSDIRLVSRNPKAVNPGDQLVAADLTKSKEVFKAVEGSEAVYLTVGLPYSIKIWEAQWPTLMRNVVNACEETGARLVFFDNIYMYDPSNLNPITEQTPWNPHSRKGKVRAEIARMVLDAHERGRTQTLIARAADFYGPSIKERSVLTEVVFKNLNQGKKAQWLGSTRFKHSFTYTPDAGKATALLGNTPDAYGQEWHLPTAPDPWTGQEWIDHIAEAMGKKSSVQVAPKWLVRILGMFDPTMKEFIEMMYQYDRDYVFDSSKFEKRFNWKPTPYEQGVREIVAMDYGK